MNFGFTEEQELLRAEVRKFLDQNCNLDEVRKIAEGEFDKLGDTSTLADPSVVDDLIEGRKLEMAQGS